MATEQHIEVKRTARFYTHGKLTENTQHIIFAIHGYGELAGKFIRPFEELDADRFFVVAPEGLNRFYWHSSSRPPVATWMTSTDRENEIKDYVNYLNQLFHQIMDKVPSSTNIKIHILGFSQGVATVTRWLTNGGINADSLILWAGKMAHDLDWKTAQPIFEAVNLYLVYGLQDKYLDYLDIDNYLKELKDKGLRYEILTFEGNHIVHWETLKDLAGKF
ncbi:MAG: hypothetical protein R3E32_29585 [Chitinophagales bacterium]